MLAGARPKIQAGIFVRDHVRLDLDRGSAVEGGKFDAEIVPAGTRFLLEIRCDGWDADLEPEQIAYFDALCSEVLGGNLSLGGKTGLGYGLYHVVCKAYRDIDLTTPEGMTSWLGLSHFGIPETICGNAVSIGQSSVQLGEGLDGWIEVPLESSGPILIGGGRMDRPASTGSEADIIFALTPRLDYDSKTHLHWNAVLPASSIRGVFRHAVNDILQSLGSQDSEKLLNGMFGFVDASHAKCGKLIMTDVTLRSETANFQFQPHVALDRFSSAALDGALFSEEPFWNERTRAVLRIRACSLEAHEAALFFHALFDWLEGSLAIGSGANRGNGRLALPGWRKDPARAFDLLGGDLAWNGVKIFGNGPKILAELAPLWDRALKEAL